ncbi:MAG: acyl-CoA synthetase [Actinobacteria bacterium]|nr:MAG: acyl-CoA synthetase [Actinomycetota bacterium]
MNEPQRSDGSTEARVIPELLRERAAMHPDRPYLGCEDRSLTYAEIDTRTDHVAAGLAERGVAPGDRVAVISANRMEMLELFFACAKAGAAMVPLNVFLKGEFLRYQLRDSQAQTLVVDGPGLESAGDLLGELPDLARVVTLDAPERIAVESVSYDIVASSTAQVPSPGLSPSSLMSILYTSGTTGMPKGCMLPHGWYMNGARVSSEMVEYRTDDVLFTALPLFHAWAQGIVMGALVHHLTAWVDPIFSVTRLLDRFLETGASVFTGVGAMGMAMLGAPPSDKDRAHRLRCALMIPFTPEQQEMFKARFGATVLSQLYGQTECGAITYARLSERRNLGSIGRPAPYLEVRLHDDDDREVPAGSVGEIVVRPRVPNALYLGYWRKPSATVEAWRNLWHHTGDYGRADAEGFITFVDRKKDALRRRGENVASHPAIAEAAVIGVPSPMTEDDIKACIVVVSDSGVPSPSELFAFFKEVLPYFAIPRYVEVVPELPKNATLRVMKHLLRERGVTPETWDLVAMGFEVGRDARR